MNNEHNGKPSGKPKISVKRIMPDSSAAAKSATPPSTAKMGFFSPIANLIGKRVVAQRKTGAMYIGILEDLCNINGFIRFSDCTIHGTRETHYVGDAYVFFQRGTAEFAHFHLVTEEVSK